MSETNAWRNKYLQALDENEQLEQRSELWQALLRRAVLRISVAASGLDEELDRVLKGLRDTLRHKAEYNQLERYMLVVEDAITAFENRRHAGASTTLKAIQRLCGQIEALNIPAGPKKTLRQFNRHLKSEIEHPHKLPSVLTELSELQASALGQLQEKKPGFWQRLSQRRPPEPEQAKHSGGPSPESGERAESASVTIVEGQYRSIDDSGNGEVEQPGAEAILQRSLREPAFSTISDRLIQALRELLDNLEPTACVEQKAANARKRIERGLNWHELAPTLEDVRDLVMQACLAADRKFGEYLTTINAELETVCQALGVAISAESDVLQAADELQISLRDQVQTLEVSLSDSSDLESLKRRVSSHIESLHTALERFDTRQRRADMPLAQQLRALVERVETMEDQARQHQIDLEEQRRKALQDPLTRLPNREAYSERVYLEYQRWKRYRHPLALAVCDIDFFKNINDTYGHQVGDRVLRMLSRAISSRLRKVDFIARYGGEEFVLLLPETSAETARQILDKIRETIASTPFHFKENPVRITVSVGLTEFTGKDTVETAFARADKRLYEAKQQGRNRCLLA